MTFRVMSFNIRGSFHDDGDNVWDQREALNIATIQKYDPDIIGFQEAQEGNLLAYDEQFPDYDVELGLISIRKADNYHRLPIYWKSERFTKLECGGYYLSETPDQFSIGWDAKFPRAVTWLVLEDNDTHLPFALLNTHFPHEQGKDDTRLKCAQLIIEHLQSTLSEMPQIVMADFNSLPDSATYKAFQAAGYVDTYAASSYDDDINTYHGFQGENFPAKGLRIDWILGYDKQARLNVKDCLVITDAEPPIYPGDHYPLLVELEIV